MCQSSPDDVTSFRGTRLQSFTNHRTDALLHQESPTNHKPNSVSYISQSSQVLNIDNSCQKDKPSHHYFSMKNNRTPKINGSDNSIYYIDSFGKPKSNQSQDNFNTNSKKQVRFKADFPLSNSVSEETKNKPSVIV